MAGIRAVAFQDFCCSNGCLAQCSCSALCPSLPFLLLLAFRSANLTVLCPAAEYKAVEGRGAQ